MTDRAELTRQPMKPKYRTNDVVWLREFDNGDEVQPRQRCTIIQADSGDDWVSYIGTVEPVDHDDDGLREFGEDQVEGPAEGRVRMTRAGREYYRGYRATMKGKKP